MKDHLNFILFLFTIVLLNQGCIPSEQKKPESYPNIVYILADDMGYGDINRLNENSKIPTPNMDKLFCSNIIQWAELACEMETQILFDCV